MTPVLTVLSSPESAASDHLLTKLAGFLGIGCEETDAKRLLAGRLPENSVLVAIHARTLRNGLAGRLAETELKPLLTQRSAKVLVYGFTASAEDAQLLQALTEGVVFGAELVQNDRRKYLFDTALDRREVPLAGLSCEVGETREVFTFAIRESSPAVASLVSVNGRPLMALQRTAGAQLFLLADSTFADLDVLIGPASSVRDLYSTLLPAVVLLRTAFEQACWSNPFPSATMIIDDPLIRRRYGFLEYEPLLAEAETNGYAVTVAFIPFNHARSERRTAEFLRGHLDRFSLAIHGCDHTGTEFGPVDEALLGHKARLAVTRMGQHEQRTSLPFDQVMVFPQGLYSTWALKALKRSGYSAAVNTEAHPVDGDGHPLTLRDLIDGAVMAYHSFPLFLRRYPRSVFDSAVDLLFGKPVLLVEHHGYFKPGYAPLAAFVKQVNQLADGIAWMPLGEAVTSHALFRPLARERYAVKFFTPVFYLRNPAPGRALLALEKSETEPDLVDHVAVDGRRVDFTAKAGTLACEVELPARGTCRVNVAYRQTPAPPYKLSMSYRCSAAARRYLSEIRDNYIARNNRLLSIAVRLKDVACRSR